MPTIIAPYIGAPIFPAIKIDVGPSAPPIMPIEAASGRPKSNPAYYNFLILILLRLSLRLSSSL